ncbi:CHAT domain-containing protein, partial [Microlunatus aurantiacus]|uniref:CHAT domain-containing protein n=1 Tax=Microlunatus aurantiacus TaxID=446786 RepID=UPI0031D795C6
MDICRCEVFDANGTNPRLRWWSATDAPVQERRLDRAEMEAWAARVESDYQTLAPDLTGLGDSLYQWLDGPTQRWLEAARSRQQPIALYIDVQERLRGLPWELIFADAFLSVHPARPVIPVRAASPRDGSGKRAPQNRPLRVLFMASSPDGVKPVLDFEREESEILAAAPGRVEVVVEESGSVAGLAERLDWFGPDYFDVLHLSGHSTVGPAGPQFVMEDDAGLRSDAAASDIAAAVGGNWPRLVFVSGCSTGQSPESGLVASMAESLVDAGAPAVLGWALPVGDQSASQLASSL